MLIDSAVYADLVGKRYVAGGRDPLTGIDCWGLAIELCGRLGIKLPDPFSAQLDASIIPLDAEQWIKKMFGGWMRISEPVPGCAVGISLKGRALDHIGIVVDNKQFVHSIKGCGVIVSRFDRAPYDERILGFYAYNQH